MPNGHNATPRFYHPVLLLIACAVAIWFYGSHRSLWWAGLALVAAAGCGWCLSFNWVMWDAMDYGGAYTPAEQIAAARRKHRVVAPLLTIGFVASAAGVLFWIGRAG